MHLRKATGYNILSDKLFQLLSIKIQEAMQLIFCKNIRLDLDLYSYAPTTLMVMISQSARSFNFVQKLV